MSTSTSKSTLKKSNQAVRAIRFVDKADADVDDAIYLVREQDLPVPWCEMSTWSQAQITAHYAPLVEEAWKEELLKRDHAMHLDKQEVGPNTSKHLWEWSYSKQSYFEKHPDVFIPLRIGYKRRGDDNDTPISYPFNILQVIGEVAFHDNE